MGKDGGAGEGGGEGKDPIFEVPEEVVGDVVALPTEKDLLEQGADPAEIEMMRGQGAVAEEEKGADKAGAKGKGAGGKAEEEEGGEGDGAAADKAKAAADKERADKARAGGGDDEPWALTAEEERKLKETFGENHKLTGVYFRMRTATRKEKRARAQLEELGLTVEEIRAENEALKEKLSKITAAAAAGGKKGRGGEGEEGDPLEELLKVEGGEAGGEGGAGKGGKDKPLTKADLDRIEAEKAAAAKKASEDQVMRQRKMAVRMNAFVEDARDRFEDYEKVSALAEEVLADLQGDGELFKGDPDRAELADVRARRFVVAAAKALDWKEGEKTPAELLYELGKLHPEFSKQASGDDPEKAVPAGSSGRVVKRIAENAGKRSSASVGGGTSHRGVSEKDLTLEQYLRLPREEQDRVSDATRRRLLEE